MSEKDILSNVCIDEMSLKCGLHYIVSKDRIDGFVNTDYGGSQETSKQELVFMATGLAYIKATGMASVLRCQILQHFARRTSS